MKETVDTTDVSKDWKAWLAFVVLAFVWGGSFILIKKGLTHFQAIEVGAFRIGLSAIAFVPIFFLSKVKFPKGKFWMITLVVLIGNGVTAFLYALAETRLGSAVTGVLNSLTPIFTLFIGVFFFGTLIRKQHLWGVVLGCIGVGVLMVGERDWRVSFFVLFVVLATFCYGLSANMVKRYCQDIHPIALTTVGFFSLGIVSLMILGFTGAFQKMTDPLVWKESMIPLIGLALVCTVFANLLFYWLLQRTTAVFGSAIAYAIPRGDRRRGG
jgi:drug/metabolite transporter (DMT)-like permease